MIFIAETCKISYIHHMPGNLKDMDKSVGSYFYLHSDRYKMVITLSPAVLTRFGKPMFQLKFNLA